MPLFKIGEFAFAPFAVACTLFPPRYACGARLLNASCVITDGCFCAGVQNRRLCRPIFSGFSNSGTD